MSTECDKDGRRTRVAECSFADTAPDLDELVLICESFRPGDYLEIGLRLEDGVPKLTLKRQRVGLGTVAIDPVPLVTKDGRRVDWRAALTLASAQLRNRHAAGSP
jgi:hypothetical protein